MTTASNMQHSTAPDLAALYDDTATLAYRLDVLGAVGRALLDFYREVPLTEAQRSHLHAQRLRWQDRYTDTQQCVGSLATTLRESLGNATLPAGDADFEADLDRALGGAS